MVMKRQFVSGGACIFGLISVLDGDQVRRFNDSHTGSNNRIPLSQCYDKIGAVSAPESWENEYQRGRVNLPTLAICSV